MMDDLPVVRRHDVPSPDAQVFFTDSLNHKFLGGYKPDFKDLQYFDLNTRWDEYNKKLREIARKETEERLRKIAEERGETYEPKKKKDPKKSEATMAFTSQGGAELSHILLDEVIRTAGASPLSVDFDVSLHGIEANRNIIKLMVTPPFLAATLCLLAAGGLVMWQGFNRFGDPIRLRPDYAQGPVSLAETAADFMAVANRAHKTGGEYAALIRKPIRTPCWTRGKSG